jgi:hypothetical protein
MAFQENRRELKMISKTYRVVTKLLHELQDEPKKSLPPKTKMFHPAKRKTTNAIAIFEPLLGRGKPRQQMTVI